MQYPFSNSVWCLTLSKIRRLIQCSRSFSQLLNEHLFRSSGEILNENTSLRPGQICLCHLNDRGRRNEIGRKIKTDGPEVPELSGRGDFHPRQDPPGKWFTTQGDVTFRRPKKKAKPSSAVFISICRNGSSMAAPDTLPQKSPLVRTRNGHKTDGGYLSLGSLVGSGCWCHSSKSCLCLLMAFGVYFFLLLLVGQAAPICGHIIHGSFRNNFMS